MTDRCSMYDMCDKEVIDLVSGQRLGFISDAEIDISSGKVICFVIEGRKKLFGLLGKEPDTSIKWDEIEKIGEDIILVRIENRETKRLPERKFYY